MMTATLTVERADFAAIEESPQSIITEGLLEAVKSEEVCDLIAYLLHPTQVP